MANRSRPPAEEELAQIRRYEDFSTIGKLCYTRDSTPVQPHWNSAPLPD